MLSFSFTFPATIWALDGLDPYLIGIGRAAFAAVLAGLALLSVRAPLPRRWGGLALVGLGVVFGFPILTSLALGAGATSAHSAVVIGLLPAATAILAVLRAGERPSRTFWIASGAGALCITVFTLAQGHGGFSWADLLLFGALLLAAVGYTEGGRLAKEMPAWQVICWAMVLCAPITVPVTGVLLATTDPHWTGEAVAGFAYVSLFSAFLGFFAWYRGMALAGIARASQVQLTQPLLTLVWSALFLGEHLDVATGVAAAGVLVCVAWTQRSRTPQNTVQHLDPVRAPG